MTAGTPSAGGALADVFTRVRQQGRAALIGYLPAGFPSADGAVAACRAMVDSGVDVVEIGLPYSDPLMDGPTIQRAVDAALAAGTTTPDVLRTVERVAASGVPVLVMTYWNPVERYGCDRFASDAAAAGAAGVITPDLTPEEGRPWLEAARAHALDTVFLVAPTSTDRRIAAVAGVSTGFVYATSLMGVTGARNAVSGRAAELVARVRAATDRPVAVGLGVSTGDQAAQVAGFADGVIVGSAFVSPLADAPSLDEGLRAVSTLAGELADGVRRGAGTRTASA